MNGPASAPPQFESSDRQSSSIPPHVRFLADTCDDPLTFVLGAFDWTKAAGHDHGGEPGPDDWQIDILEAIRAKHLTVEEALRIAVASGHGIGKAHPKSMMLHTPRGLVRWGDLKSGDYVFGRDGKPTRVMAVHEQGNLPVYRVCFDDGSSTITCGNHLWSVRGRQQRRNGGGWVTMTTAQILEHGIKRPNGSARARQWELPRHGAVEFEPRAPLPLSPYVLGVWLGDGGRNSGYITSIDMEVIDHLRSVGADVRKASGQSWYLRGIKSALRSLGVLDRYSYQKSVPPMFMEASSQDRAELLRGLLDTDGECSSQGTIIFNSTSRALVDDVVWIARSLGGKAQIQPTVKRPTYRGARGELLDGRPCWRATIQMPHGFKAFYITRKQDRIKAVEGRYLSRWFDSIELVGEEDCACITVDAPDRLYLANDFIVTHNTALIAWIIIWFVTTKPHSNGIVTANTGAQLNSKTWREVNVWFERLWPDLKGDFAITATKLYHRDHERTWFIQALEWNEKRPEAFAGMHAKWVLVIFDEGSAIPPIIWETVEGAMTTAHAMFIVFGNPTRNEGAFFDCFHKMRHRWITRQIDSRTVRMTNKKQIEQWVDDYGDDSDFVRVRVRGVFPSRSSSQFIGTDVMEAAQKKFQRIPQVIEPQVSTHAEAIGDLVLGVDVARFGTDASTVWWRRGRYARRLKRYYGIDTYRFATYIAEIIDDLSPRKVFIDGVGVGAGVIDTLRGLGYGRYVVEVLGSAKATHEKEYVNLRAECWGKMRDWLKAEAAVELPDQQAMDDFTGLEYFFDKKQRIQLESKDDLKSRGLPSPDNADALAMTFAVRLATLEQGGDSDRYGGKRKGAGSAWTG